jgi:hypothetical protein
LQHFQPQAQQQAPLFVPKPPAGVIRDGVARCSVNRWEIPVFCRVRRCPTRKLGDVSIAMRRAKEPESRL